jgi:hypothetical protein
MTTKKKVAKKKVSKKATKKTVSKKPVGRPTKYDPAFCEIVIEEMSKGYSKEATAGYLRISKDTLYEWAKKHKEFSDAVRIGESLSQRHWEETLVKHKTHTKNGTQINSQVFNLNMKNRFGWRDKQDVTTSDDKPKDKKTFAFDLSDDPTE